MNHLKQPLLSIGSFASAARLSLKALRLYDRLDICKPSYVDPESGYRYYQVTQLREARLIRMMRQMEMPLAIIRQVLTVTPEDAEQLVQNYWQMREQRMEQTQRVVPDLIRYLRQEMSTMSLEVEVKTIEPQRVLSITRSLTVEHLSPTIMSDLDTLYQLAKENQITVAGPPFGIYHGPINHEDDGPIEICLPIAQTTTPVKTEVTLRELAGGKAASVTLRDDQCAFPTLLAGYDAVQDWIQQNGYEAIDAPREIWYGSPGKDAQWDIVWLFQES
ncbi:MAG: MerR family transcriptional regulator [Leptolyngbyaceae cyanobacterium SL_5_9]|nr:MerR family transcriptional regulator [Leptolyngbyaceae cyanobacterium SL_5_9]NJO75694.1 MerR family transcriptional regulator [Leptolyngbyaceae cyanobacterium RM1_406_9]